LIEDQTDAARRGEDATEPTERRGCRARGAHRPAPPGDCPPLTGHDGPRFIVTPGTPSALAVDARDDRVFAVISAQGHSYLVVLDGARGTLLRTTPLGSAPRDLAVAVATRRVFVADRVDNTVSVLDARTGVLLRTVAVNPMPLYGAQPLALDAAAGRLFVAASGGSTMVGRDPVRALSVLDARAGALVRVVAAGGGAMAADERRDRIFAADEGGVAALDARRLTVRWRTALPVAPYHVVVAPRAGRVIVSAADVMARVDLLAASSGKLLRTIPHAGQIMALDDQQGRIIAATDTRLRVLDARSGRLIRSLPITGVVAVAVDGRRGCVFVATTNGRGNGRLSAIDERTGRIRAVIDLGGDPTDVAVDGRGGRVVVAVIGRSVSHPSPWAWLPQPLLHRLPFLAAPSTRSVPSGLRLLNAAC